MTAVGAREAGFISVWPCDERQPNASNLNFAAGQTIPNSVTSKVSPSSTVCLFTSGGTDLLMEVAGQFA